MASTTAKGTPGRKRKKNKEKTLKKKLDIAAIAVSDNIVYSKSDQWAYYRLSNNSFDFLSTTAKLAGAVRLINAFGALMSDRTDPLDCHLIISSVPFDVDAYYAQLESKSQDWTPAAGFDHYMEKQYEFLLRQEFMRKQTYLGVHLGKRGAFAFNTSAALESGVEGAFSAVKEWLDTSLTTSPAQAISEAEEQEARRKEEEFYQTLSVGNFQAERCSTKELLYMMKRQFYPLMPVPEIEVDAHHRLGPGDLALEFSSEIYNKLKYVKINQTMDGEDYSGCRATLTLARLPKFVDFPNGSFPFLYWLTKHGAAFTSYARFTLNPNPKVKKQLERKKAEAKDEFKNMEGTDSANSPSGSLPQDVVEAMQDMDLLSNLLENDRLPWVEGVYRVVVETETEEQLKALCSQVKQIYKDIDVTTTWTVGDQMRLFLEQMPGDKLRERSQRIITNLNMLGTSGFTYSSEAGDKVYTAYFDDEDDDETKVRKYLQAQKKRKL